MDVLRRLGSREIHVPVSRLMKSFTKSVEPFFLLVYCRRESWPLCRAVPLDRAGSPDPAKPDLGVGSRLRGAALHTLADHALFVPRASCHNQRDQSTPGQQQRSRLRRLTSGTDADVSRPEIFRECNG